MKKRLLSLGICLLLCFSLLPISASAAYYDRVETVRYDLNGGYILVQSKDLDYEIHYSNMGDIVYVSPELEGDVVIPETVAGITVKNILVYSMENDFDFVYGFQLCSKITSLTLPGTIKVVEAYTLPHTEESSYTVILEEGVEELRAGRTGNIEKYVLPKSLKVLEGRNSTNPKLSFELHPDNPNFVIDEQGLIYSADRKTLAAASRDGEEVKNYTIPYGVEKIETDAFYACPALTDIFFPDSIQQIYSGYSYLSKRLHARSGGAVEKSVKEHNEKVEEGREPIKFVSTGEKLPYTDIGTGWAVPYIGWAYDNGVMTGATDTTFSPGSYMTRGMAVTTLHRISGEKSDYQHPFTDVSSSAYYSEAVSWAAENGVVNGVTETQFAPGKNITREQLAVILYRYAQYLETDTSKRADLNKYTDANSISVYALTAMQWANAEGILSGRTETSLSPKGITTRAEYAAVLQRLVG